jgi:hypothetical protein
MTVGPASTPDTANTLIIKIKIMHIAAGFASFLRFVE